MFEVQNDIDLKFREAVEKAEGTKKALAEDRAFAKELEEKIGDLVKDQLLRERKHVLE